MSTLKVRSLSHASLAVAAVERAAEAWSALGFSICDEQPLLGCRSYRIPFAQGGLRLFGVAGDVARGTLGGAVAERLADGDEGLFGWSWSANDTPAAELVDAAHTPGATTFLETADPTGDSPTNQTSAIDHVVIVTGDVEATAAAYEASFGLSAKYKEMKGQRYAFLKVGGPVIEIVGPIETGRAEIPTRLWGLALRSIDLDATAACLQQHGAAFSGPKPAIQGGRILSLREPITGVPLAWLGD